jgi:hypothetical protein
MVILSFLVSVLWVAMLVGFIVAVFWVIATVVFIRGYKRWVHGDPIEAEEDLIDDVLGR